MSMNVVEASGLGKRYGSTWALRECTLEAPAGHMAALAGPNGAGQSTLLNLAVGLAAPSAGTVTVLGGPRVAGRAGRDRVRRPGHAAVQEPVGRGAAAPDPAL
jgi:ABC-2 type transport system ATP-binding protein